MTDTISPAELAAAVGCSEGYARQQARLGNIEGARKVGVGRRGMWEIPAGAAETWKPAKRGRPKKEQPSTENNQNQEQPKS